MKLLIISNMEHYRNLDGSIWGWGPTVQEINQLATLFGSVTHIGCLHEGLPSKSSLPYTIKNLEFIPLPPSGGPRLLDKLGILRLAPTYLLTMWRELRKADVIHIRCPANIPLLAIILLSFFPVPKKRWIKYAGNWNPGRIDRISYAFQRWWLRNNFARSLVTVNGDWPQQPKHIYCFFNPCLSEQDLLDGKRIAKNKSLTLPLRLIFIGGLNTSKGAGRAIRILAMFRAEGIEAFLDLIGDGPERPIFERLATDLSMRGYLNFHGWMKRTDLGPLLAKSHCILLPSATEGWPKVLSEAMAYGVVPLAGAVSSIPQYLRQFGCGSAIPADDLAGYVRTLKRYIEYPEIWREESLNGVTAAHHFSYTSYLCAVSRLMELESK